MQLHDDQPLAQRLRHRMHPLLQPPRRHDQVRVAQLYRQLTGLEGGDVDAARLEAVVVAQLTAPPLICCLHMEQMAKVPTSDT